MLERNYQAKLKKKIQSLLPSCYIIKQDPNSIQGIPDLVIFFKNRYAMLEVKRSSVASIRPNQKYYVNKFDKWAFASFIYPENEKQVLDDMIIYLVSGINKSRKGEKKYGME